MQEETAQMANLLYIENFMSFLYVSDYSIFNGKINGIVKIQINYINQIEKDIIFECVKETFLDKYSFDNLTNTLVIQLKRK